MSIATLKKKTRTQYNNMSVGSKHGFSLNGTHRSQGYVGQTSLSRSLPTTPMRGNVAKGYGGCCGNYVIKPIIQSAVVSLNDPKVIKSSVLGTSGMLSTQYRWIRRPHPFISVKASNDNNLKSQSYHIDKIRNLTLIATTSGPCKSIYPHLPICKTDCNKSSNYNILQKLQPITKDLNNKLSLAQSTYIQYLNNGCVIENKPNPNNNTSGKPFICGSKLSIIN
jgi:hypothetical protein